MEQIQRIPFLRLLLPLLAGIIIQYYWCIQKWSIIPLLTGLGIMLFSYFVPQKKLFDLRWLYGCGLFIFLFSIGVISTQIRQQLSAFSFPDISEFYNAVITDIPEEKPNTFAYNVELTDRNKKIVCYLPKDTNSRNLKVGDNILFFSKIEPFKSPRSNSNFNYARYMYNKGYAGYTLVREDQWEKTEKTTSNLFIKAAKCRQKILNLYQSLDLNNDEYAILSALTLGYKDALSDDISQSFRATGTAHILAVSGMHVGIIYLIILSLLKFDFRNPKYSWIKQTIVIFCLWVYAFVIGFPPSAVRACTMLSLFCISQMRGIKTYSLNTLCATAFLMLIWNPLSLFDPGFQLSFVAVLSILLLLPILSKKKFIENKYLRYFRNVFLLSLAAQIGTFPLCLYYFGTFPSYFFLTNLLIIPLISLIVYDAVLIIVASGLSIIFAQASAYLTVIPILIYKVLIFVTIKVIHFFQNLPFAQLQDIKVSFVGLVLLWAISIFFVYFIINKKPKSLICALTCGLVFIFTIILSTMGNKNTVNVYNIPKSTRISYYMGYKQWDITDITENKMICLNGQKYFILTKDIWKERQSLRKFDIDYMHIVGNNSVSMYSLTQKFNIKKVILDSSLSNKSLKRFVSECEKLRIPYYDVSENGVLRIFF